MVTYTDNEPLLDLFMGQPIGIFSIVDEESRFPGATDQSLIHKLNKNFKSNAVCSPALCAKSLSLVHLSCLNFLIFS